MNISRVVIKSINKKRTIIVLMCLRVGIVR